METIYEKLDGAFLGKGSKFFNVFGWLVEH